MVRKLAHLFAFLFLFSRSIVLADAGASCPESFRKLTQLIGRNSFETERDFKTYAELFPPSFLEGLSKLNREGHWLDAGSGDGFALQDFFNETVIDEGAFLKNAEPSHWRPRRL